MTSYSSCPDKAAMWASAFPSIQRVLRDKTMDNGSDGKDSNSHVLDTLGPGSTEALERRHSLSCNGPAGDVLPKVEEQ